ncbi:hypothetical protein C5167_000439 [Papaver somniferum]|uniref:Uncharacterized protein n=1 Tax=Papaver somniferum TaxID=3469 RepID=A0A4Y7KW41_PAPSO|nr:hypothetical protein C5167_000439 [Papaver somniferum]
MWESKVVNNDMEYPTDQKLSVKGRDGHISGVDATKMKMRTSLRIIMISLYGMIHAHVRWWHTTKTFRFPDFEIGLTPLGFVMLTGSRFSKRVVTGQAPFKQHKLDVVGPSQLKRQKL